MKIKDLEFVEQYLYEKPEGNYSRGISVYINRIKLLSFDLHKEQHPVTKEEEDANDFLPERDILFIRFDGIIPQNFIAGRAENDVDFSGQRYFLLSDKESAKKEAIAIVKRFINFFVIEEKIDEVDTKNTFSEDSTLKEIFVEDGQYLVEVHNSVLHTISML